MSAVLGLLIPLLIGVAVGVRARNAGRRTSGPPEADTREELDRHRRPEAALSGAAARH